VVVIEDLTQILATQRLEAWKEAVERVIHEVKNPLTPVGLAAETLKTAWARDPARFADLFPSAIDMILGAVRDLKELIGEFSRFSRLPAMRTERLDPNALVLDALAPYTKTPPEELRVKVQLAPDAPEVEADADQIKRVLLNVINNALEAMGETGGALRLFTLREQGGVTIRVEIDGLRQGKLGVPAARLCRRLGRVDGSRASTEQRQKDTGPASNRAHALVSSNNHAEFRPAPGSHTPAAAQALRLGRRLAQELPQGAKNLAVSGARHDACSLGQTWILGRSLAASPRKRPPNGSAHRDRTSSWSSALRRPCTRSAGSCSISSPCFCGSPEVSRSFRACWSSGSRSFWWCC